MTDSVFIFENILCILSRSNLWDRKNSVAHIIYGENTISTNFSDCTDFDLITNPYSVQVQRKIWMNLKLRPDNSLKKANFSLSPYRHLVNCDIS